MTAIMDMPLHEPHDSLRAARLWGVAVGLAQAATPLVFWWLNTAAVYAIGTVGIAFIYIGFAVADGRPKRPIATAPAPTGSAGRRRSRRR